MLIRQTRMQTIRRDDHKIISHDGHKIFEYQSLNQYEFMLNHASSNVIVSDAKLATLTTEVNRHITSNFYLNLCS